MMLDVDNYQRQGRKPSSWYGQSAFACFIRGIGYNDLKILSNFTTIIQVTALGKVHLNWKLIDNFNGV